MPVILGTRMQTQILTQTLNLKVSPEELRLAIEYIEKAINKLKRLGNRVFTLYLEVDDVEVKRSVEEWINTLNNCLTTLRKSEITVKELKDIESEIEDILQDIELVVDMDDYEYWVLNTASEYLGWALEEIDDAIWEKESEWEEEEEEEDEEWEEEY